MCRLVIAAAFHDGDGLAFDEFAHGVDATKGKNGVADRGFDQYGQIAARGYLKHDTAYWYPKYIFGLILRGQALKGLRR